MKLKKIMSTALAAVMVTSVMSIGAVSSVSAAAIDESPSVAVEVGGKYNLTSKAIDGLPSLFADGNEAGTIAHSSDNRFITNGKVDSHGPNLKGNDNHALKLLTPSDSNGVKLWIKEEGVDYKVSYGTTSETSGNRTIFVTKKIDPDTVVTIEGASTKSTSKINEIEVLSGADSTSFYTISGTVKVGGVAQSDVPLVLYGSEHTDGLEVNSGSDGTYKFENIGNNEKFLITIADTDGYFGTSQEFSNLSSNVENADFSLEAKVTAATVDAAEDVNLLEGLTASADSEEIPNDYVIGKYFTVAKNHTSGTNAVKKRYNGSSVTSIELPKDESGVLQFTTTKPFNVIIECSSNSTAASSDIAILNDSGVLKNMLTCTTSTTNVVLTIADLPAGKYEIAEPTSEHGGTNDKAVRIYSVKFKDPGGTSTVKTADKVIAAHGEFYAPAENSTDTYIIHPLNSNDLTGKAHLVLRKSGSETENAVSTDTVYKSVKLGDDSIVNASDLNSDYLYAISVTETNGAGPTEKMAWTTTTD